VNYRILVIAAACAVLGGCGSAVSFTSAPRAASSAASPSASAVAEPGVATYLCQFSDGDLLLQWTANGGYLDGTYQDAALSGTPPQESVDTTQGALSGGLNGSGITLNINSATWYGTVSGSAVTVNVPQQDGTIQPATCDQSSVTGWNSAIASLNSQTSGNNGAAAQQQQQAAQASANAAAQQQAQSDLTTLQGLSLASDLSKLSGDLSKTSTDLAAEKTVAAAGPNADGGDCYNLESNVNYDAEDDVEYDAQDDFGYDLQENLQPDISSARNDVSTLQSDLSGLANMGLPAPQGAQAAITAANDAISGAISTANADISQENGYVSQAYAVANATATGSCAGDGPGSPPAPVQDIS
jgi:hypothetical protein